MAETYCSFNVDQNYGGVKKSSSIKLDLDTTALHTIIETFLQFLYHDLALDIDSFKGFFDKKFFEGSLISQYHSDEITDGMSNENNNIEHIHNHNNNNDSHKVDVMQFAIEQKKQMKEFLKELNHSEEFLQKVYNIYIEWVSGT